MSSLKHVLKTRTYRERSQPAARKRLGLLEKHKDYKLRARDYHRKQNALNVLREKAAFKNPDEFYFGMVHTKIKDGVHQKKGGSQPTEEELIAFNREDAGYVGSKLAAEAKKVAPPRASMASISCKNRRTSGSSLSTARLEMARRPRQREVKPPRGTSPEKLLELRSARALRAASPSLLHAQRRTRSI